LARPVPRRGLVEIAVDADDRRGRLLALTKAGAKALRSRSGRAHRELDEKLTAKAADTLRALS